jgi:Uma2 family endonuclease
VSAQPQPRLTPEQYLQAERAADYRSEYFNGRMCAMSGGSYRHAQMISGLVGELGSALRKRPCSVVPIGLRLRVSPTGLYTYPDVIVTCGEPKFADDQKDTLLNPTLIVEVLSPSTEAYDRGFKFAQYRTLASLQEYVLVSQDEPRIEVFHRQPDGHWLLSEAIGLEADCRFESLDCSLPLADIYDKVVFDAGEVAPSARPAL